MIKTVLDIRKQEERIEYPRLMTSKAKGSILLMTSRRTGTILYEGTSGFEVGHSSQLWVSADLVPYTGTLTLENQS